jgi:flagellar biosynthesis chaperone FliJ
MSRAFSLAGLLRVRSAQEREAAQRLSRAAIEASQTEARDRQLRAALGAGGADPGTPDALTLAAVAASRAAGRALLAELTDLGVLQQQVLREHRASHDASRREVRGLEKLAHAHALRERAEALRAEQIELDEIAARRAEEDA